MKLGPILGIVAAVVLHVLFLLFGGLLIPEAQKGAGTTQQVDLLTDTTVTKDKPKEPEPTPEQELKPEEEQVPDAAEVIKNLEIAPNHDAPALDAASLGAIEQALGNAAGGAGFGDALSFNSGGRIGGTGKAGGIEQGLDNAFSLAEIDQKPRPTVQPAPMYPSEMRGRKVEGIVTVVFVVDASGKVTDPRIEKSSNPAFDKPALQAVKQWRFEPAVKAGQRVACRMRAPLRFQPS